MNIDSKSGMVFTKAQLDREAEYNSGGAFILEITATEVSKLVPPPSVATEVTVILTDVNDEIPSFRSLRYSAEINENAPVNTPITILGDAIPEVYDHDLVKKKEKNILYQFNVGRKAIDYSDALFHYAGNERDLRNVY